MFNLATAPGEKDTPSLIEFERLWTSEITLWQKGDFQQRSKKTEAFFAGVIKASGMMLEWAAEHVTEIVTGHIDLEILPTVTNVERGVRNLEFVLQQMHTARMALTSYEANDTVANSRKNPLAAWRRLQKRHDPTTGGSNEICCERSFSWTLLAGFEPLVHEELEKHLLLNSNRLRTFEDARLELVTYAEAKFCLRIRDSNPSDTGHDDPMDVDAVNSLSASKGKGSSSPRDGWLFRVRWSTFPTRLQGTERQRQAIVWQGQTEQVMAQE